jgi:putative acetyltransferase
MTEFDISPPLDPEARWPEGLSIRARTPADAPGILALHNMPGYRFGTLRTPHHTIEEIRRHIESPPANNIGLVAVMDGRIVGDVGLNRYLNRRAHVGSIGMGVHDAYHGRGIARALIGEALAIADRWLNLKRMELTVYTDNEKAIRLYERNGFVKEGYLRQFAFRDGEFADAYSMARFRT